MTFVKYYPVLMQVIMLASIFDEFYPFSITNWLYPIQECSGFVYGIGY